MDIKENAGTESKGVFEFGGAEQATKDAAATEVETATEETPEGATDNSNATDQQETDQSTDTQETPEGQEEGQTTEGKATVVTEKPFEVNGRTFTSKDELITAYQNSSTEGIRLDKLSKEYEMKLAEKEARLLELEAQQINAPFPGLLSTDKEQEEAQLMMMPQHKQTEYILQKREWEKQQQTAKAEHAQKTAQLTENQKHIKEIIENSDREMASKTADYPNYTELKPTMQKIVELSPCIANRPETPYLSFWIAYGLDAYSKSKTMAAKATEAAASAKEKAKSAQTQIGKGGNGKPVSAATSGSGSAIVNAWRTRNGVEL